MAKNMPSFVEYMKDVFNPKGFFDTLYDRSKEGLVKKSDEEAKKLYKKLQTEFDSLNKERGDYRSLDKTIGILPYTRKLFEKYGVDYMRGGSFMNGKLKTLIHKGIASVEIHE